MAMGTSLYVREIWKDTGKTAAQVDLLSESPSLKGHLPLAPDRPEQGPGAIYLHVVLTAREEPPFSLCRIKGVLLLDRDVVGSMMCCSHRYFTMIICNKNL